MIDDPIIIVDENSDLRSALEDRGIDCRPIRKQLRIIAARVYNNKIGYARLRSGDTQIKLLICPKIFNYSKTDFLRYLRRYYELVALYGPKVSRHEVPDTIYQTALFVAGATGTDGLSSFDDLIDLRAKMALNGIHGFFNKLKSVERSYVDHVSNAITGRLNLRKAVTEINQARVHQNVPVDTIFSELAGVAVFALDFFSHSSTLGSALVAQAKRTRSVVGKKFGVDPKDYRLMDVLTARVRKHFTGKQKEQLYQDILTILGAESFFDDREVSGPEDGKGNAPKMVFSKDVAMDIVFFDASRVFEYFVYDYFVKQSVNAKYSVEMHPSRHFSIRNTAGEKCLLESKPDISLLLDEKNLAVADAKWKIPTKLDAVMSADATKLHRDKVVFDSQRAYLIYPACPESVVLVGDYQFEFPPYFEFRVRAIEVLGEAAGFEDIV